MKWWTSVHGFKAAVLHGKKTNEPYVAYNTTYGFIGVATPGELNIVGSPAAIEFSLQKLKDQGWTFICHDDYCVGECSGGAVSSPVRASTPHPAKFSKEVLQVIDTICETYEIMSLIDPFGGTCRIFDVCSPFIVGNEIEREWLAQPTCDFPGRHRIQGNALLLPFKNGAFKAAATSCTYGNRMADSHDAKEKCKTCGGVGWIWASRITRPTDPEKEICSKCGGVGFNTYKRMTYKHQLGRDLHPNNSGQFQWGPKYRDFHKAAWLEMTRVVADPYGEDERFFILNISDHVRNREVQPVCEFHVEFLTSLGWVSVEEHQIETSRMRMGQNHEARVDHEMVYVFRRN